MIIPRALIHELAIGRARGGFTLIEMLIVLAIIAALLAMGFPAVNALRERGRQGRTEAAVQAISAALAVYGRGFVQVPGGRMRQLWDFNQDGFIDGHPQRDDSFDQATREEAERAGYHGPIEQLSLHLPRSMVDPSGSIMDGWGRRLRISSAAIIYGSSGVGIWSSGRDLEPSTDDDVISWGTRHAD